MKRFLDFILAIIGLLVLTPAFLLIVLFVRVKLGAPVFFCQTRPGKDGVVFKMYKFRTMTDKRDPQGDLLPDCDRLTSFGKFLRASSLDELPGLFNVIKGDMSLVGPRPLLMEYLPLYSAEQARRHEVRPGITGWAQVNGRNAIAWEDKFRLDVWYVDNRSFWLDMRILWLTVLRVVHRSGISHEGHATMEKFRGAGHREAR